MNIRRIAATLLVGALMAPACPTFAGCTLGTLAELPVTMSRALPMVTAQINGADAHFIADSGSFYSMIWTTVTDDFHLRVDPLPYELIVRGIGGTTLASYTTVKQFSLAGIPLHDVQFIVAGSGVGRDVVGVLGQNIFRVGDVEYDLANGVIRLMRPKDCGKTVLAYWATDKPYSVIPIDWATSRDPFTRAVAYLNGAKIRVVFDTGSSRSSLSVRAAERAGVRVGDSEVHSAGDLFGIGSRRVQSWIAPFTSFKIGDEEVRNTRLRISDIGIDADMLIGSDFFLSHRIYVASGQRNLYFTYNGGPVFNLEAVPLNPVRAGEPGAGHPGATPATAAGATTPATATDGAPPASGNDASAAPAALPSAADAAGTATPPETLDQPTDAAGFARRGAAFAARHQFDRALADLTRACELAPNQPDYFYQRGIARESNRQAFQAMEDFNQALKLKPEYVPALIARSALHLAARDPSAALADLDAIDRTVPKDADVRLALGNLYGRAGRFESAIAQFDLWLHDRGGSPHRSEAYFGRCRARALLGRDLSKALSDCNDAVRLEPTAARALDTRGLVRLRMRDFDKSISDYDAALSLQPKLAWSLYGRGVDEIRKGMTAKGQADIAAATALAPLLPQEAKRLGVEP
jgi:tetratricopeptide (TPR) repeat protein/predicted aspartyl protease